MALAMKLVTAAERSSKIWATISASRSMPSLDAFHREYFCLTVPGMIGWRGGLHVVHTRVPIPRSLR